MKQHENNDLIFEQFLRKNLMADIPEKAESQLRKRLFDFRKEMVHHTITGKEFSMRSIMKKLLKRRAIPVFGTAAAAVLIALVLYIKPWSDIHDGAYAAVIARFEKAKTAKYTAIMNIEGSPGVSQEIFYKEPGYYRMNMRMDTLPSYGVIDLTKKKGISVLAWNKQYFEIDFSNISDINKQQSEFNLIEHMRSLPKRADSTLGIHQKDGRDLLGFVVIEEGMRKTVWVEDSTNELVQINMNPLNMKGIHYKITDFKFDIVLDDSLFNLTPPEGYTLIKKENVSFPDNEPNENDLIAQLRFYASVHKEKLLMPLNDMGEMRKYLSQVDRNKIKELPEPDETTKKSIMSGMVFAMKMKPENDWHYAGKGVKLGSADIPIAWWKPDSSETYRVIYGDLQVRNALPETVNNFKINP